MAAEVELKLATDRESLARVRAHPAVAQLLRGRPLTRKNISTYYDTPSEELRQAGVALRVRRSGKQWLQTAKGAGDAIGAVHRRPEYEWPTRSSRIDQAKLSTTPWRGLFEATSGRLRPVFVTDIDRTEQPMTFADGTRATLCLDVGEIRSARRRTPMTEIEIELVHGEPRRLHELALSLAADLPVKIMAASKAERGYALARGAPARPVHAQKLALAPDASVGDALASYGADCLKQIIANAPCVATASRGDAGEFVHQTRVGIRRLRSLLKLIEELSGAGAAAPVDDELRWLANAFGAARDWDVFANETLAAVAKSMRASQARRDLGLLRGRATRQRNARFTDANAAAASPRSQRLLLSLGVLLATVQSAVADPAMRAPARTLATATLERGARRLGKRGAHLERLSPTERHRARIAAKKLRYVATMFAPLFPSARTREYLASLTKLQGALGLLNDLATGERLLDELAPQARTARLIHGAGMVRGWLSGTESADLADAARCWRKFAKLKPFWR